MRIDKTVLLEIQANLGYFKPEVIYKNQVVGFNKICHFCGKELKKNKLFCSVKCSNKKTNESKQV